MKKILVLFAILAFGLTLSAQTVVKSDVVATVEIDTVLLTGESVTMGYYAKDFFENTRVQVEANAQNSDEDVVMTVITQGSLDYSNFTNLDTVSISGTSDNFGVSPKIEAYYDYLRYVTAVAGTTDTVEVTLHFLLDINE